MYNELELSLNYTSGHGLGPFTLNDCERKMEIFHSYFVSLK